MTDQPSSDAGDAFRPRPPWWVDAEGRDTTAAGADERADRRDDVADERDREAEERDEVAAARERHAAELAVLAHQREDDQSSSQVDSFVQHEQLAGDEAALRRIRDLLATQPELTEVFERVLHHVDEFYVQLVRSGFQADNVRSDLRSLAQLLAGAAADRRSAEHDRARARDDRASARRDRDAARSSRQQAALDRAPRSGDYD